MIPSEPAVDCRNIHKGFGVGEAYRSILRGIDLQIGLGELFMLTGPSGSGKTTLLTILTGITGVDQGTLMLFGQRLDLLKKQEIAAFRQDHIGFVFQSFNLIPSFTALENVGLPLMIKGISRDIALEKAHSLLLLLGLSKKTKYMPQELSSGEQQRVAIARSLINEPRLIICDEPTSNLDQVAGSKIMILLKDMVLKPDRTIIVVTHDKRIYKFADRIAKMNDGVITGIYKPEDEIKSVEL